MLYLWPIVAGAILCAAQAMRASRLLVSTLWLAGASALVSTALYLMGAHEVAVIELSVGAGLVTVLFVFAISIAGEDAMKERSLVPWPLAWGMVILIVLLLGWLARPLTGIPSGSAEPSFAVVLWQNRSLDVLLQIALIFAGVVGILGLLSETKGGHT